MSTLHSVSFFFLSMLILRNNAPKRCLGFKEFRFLEKAGFLILFREKGRMYKEVNILG